jgi:hypothetical protein
LYYQLTVGQTAIPDKRRNTMLWQIPNAKAGIRRLRRPLPIRSQIIFSNSRRWRSPRFHTCNPNRGRIVAYPTKLLRLQLLLQYKRQAAPPGKSGQTVCLAMVFPCQAIDLCPGDRGVSALLFTWIAGSESY